MGAGESYDAIFTAPPYQGPGPFDTYVLYNRRYTQDDDNEVYGTQGQRTEVRVYPAGGPGALGPQQYLNQHPDDLVA